MRKFGNADRGNGESWRRVFSEVDFYLNDIRAIKDFLLLAQALLSSGISLI